MTGSPAGCTTALGSVGLTISLFVLICLINCCIKRCCNYNSVVSTKRRLGTDGKL